MKPTLKALGTKRLNLKYDVPLSNVTFKFNLRRYNLAECRSATKSASDMRAAAERARAGAADGSGVAPDVVGRCRLTTSKSVLKAPTASTLETIIS
jgi:hypothetical protein